MIISQEYRDVEAARELIARSELKRVRLRRCFADLQGEEEVLKEPFGLAQSHNTSATVLENLLRVEVAFNFQAFDASEAKVSLFSVQCSFELDYQIEEGFRPEQEAINAFKDGNAVYNCWPYARECVQNLTGRMALRPPPLPLLRVIHKPKPKMAKPSESEATAIK
ncbi:MAG TPA: hypothetical protein VMB85_12400 [Bryobacteraceae bacterium]|nr:hypothetical protein [Bryobacteraceae bacterium]